MFGMTEKLLRRKRLKSEEKIIQLNFPRVQTHFSRILIVWAIYSMGSSGFSKTKRMFFAIS